MTHVRRCVVIVAAALLGCTAILSPRDDVDRCDSVDECEPIADSRYVAECAFPPSGPGPIENAEKVCVAAYAQVRCDPSRVSGPGEVFFDTYASLSRDRSRFVPCDPSLPAPRGCPSSSLGCAPGLVVRADGICDHELAPAIPAYTADTLSDSAQDVLDAFCQSFFCDERFVCDGGACVPCSIDEPWGHGGCGRVVSAGLPSCIYVPDVQAACQAPDADPAFPGFGDCDRPE